ncbi:MAG: hypothetical protein IJX74_01445 [Clostridia bacterium]|nr:hypothetical protein [Clostridia bacterium]
MTATRSIGVIEGKKERTARLNFGHTAFCLLSGFCFILIMKNSTAAIEYMGNGLTICARTVIPSLFPFMVISELLVTSGLGEGLGRLLAPVMRRVFNLSGAGCSAAFLGSLCGFPIGAKTAVALYDKGAITRREAEHLMTFSNNPSSAFLINAVGITLLGSKSIGTLIYFCVLASGLTVGFFARFLLSQSNSEYSLKLPKASSRPSGIEAFTSGVSNAARGMLTVCAYVIFFSAVTGALSSMLSGFSDIPQAVSALLFGFFEISGGVSRAANSSSLFTSAVLCALIAGWSGLSVHFQIISICSGRGISFKPYFVAKLFQGVLSAVLTGMILHFFPSLLTTQTSANADDFVYFSAYGMRGGDVLSLVVKILFFVGCLILLIRRRKSRFSS